MAVDRNGNILIADTGNGRIEKFSPNGTFLKSIGKFEALNGIAVDRDGNIYVAEIGSKTAYKSSTLTANSSPSGKALASMDHVELPSVLMTQFMLLIRVTIESSSSVPMVRSSRVGAAREVAMDSSKALVRSPLILRITKYM